MKINRYQKLFDSSDVNNFVFLNKGRELFIGVSVFIINKINSKTYIIMNEFDEIISNEQPTLVDFFATWCGPCKMQSPILTQVKEKVGDKATIIKVDIDKNNELAARYRVQSVPTLILFKNGEPVWRAVGVQSAEILENKINEYIATKSDQEFNK